MSLDDFIITCFCWIDEAIPVVVRDKQLRQAGPPPTMSDSEVECVASALAHVIGAAGS